MKDRTKISVERGLKTLSHVITVINNSLFKLPEICFQHPYFSHVVKGSSFFYVKPNTKQICIFFFFFFLLNKDTVSAERAGHLEPINFVFVQFWLCQEFIIQPWASQCNTSELQNPHPVNEMVFLGDLHEDVFRQKVMFFIPWVAIYMNLDSLFSC